MAKPPVFDRYTHQRQQDLLKAEQNRLDSKNGWAMVGQFCMIVVGVVILVGCTLAFVFSFGR